MTEFDLIRDLLYVFQGIDGKHIKFNEPADFYLLDSSVCLPKPVTELVQKLCEMGWLYRKVNRYVMALLQSATSPGLFEQSFISTIQKELVEYYRAIATLENHLETPNKAEEDSLHQFFAKGLSLKRLWIWIHPFLQKLRLLSVLTEVCNGCKGGALISMIHNYVIHGDPVVNKYISKLLLDISAPFYTMLSRWMYKGELQDPFGEFFVSQDDGISLNASISSTAAGFNGTSAIDAMSIDDGNIWRSKYVIKYDLIPGFVSKPLAKKIFLVGKSLNFIRSSCQDFDFTLSWSQNPANDVLQYGELKKLEFSIDRAYKATTDHLIHLLLSKYKLMEHLHALKRYILLGQGDFVQYLMDSLGPSLSKPASSIYRHNLTGTLEMAIRSSNAQYDDQDILKRLDVRLLEATSGDSGWDVFALDYHVDAPISTILTQAAMHTYQKLFSFLWKLKRIEHALACSWRKQMAQPPHLRHIPQFAQDIQSCFTLRSEMTNFINQLQHYILFEVIECSWEELSTHLSQNSGDLDQLIHAHNRYLNGIVTKALLVATPNQIPISKTLFKIFETILSFDQIQEMVFQLALRESEGADSDNRARYQDKLEEEFGISSNVAGGGLSNKPLSTSMEGGANTIENARRRIKETTQLFHVTCHLVVLHWLVTDFFKNMNYRMKSNFC